MPGTIFVRSEVISLMEINKFARKGYYNRNTHYRPK